LHGKGLVSFLKTEQIEALGGEAHTLDEVEAQAGLSRRGWSKAR